MRDEPVLECQTCGEIMRRLSAAEAQRVADRPYDFIAYCSPRCQPKDTL